MPSSKLVLCALLTMSVVLALPSGAQDREVVTRPVVPGLHPGDVVRLRIWREPDLSGEFIVDQAGIVIFPKLGPTSVASTSPDSLEATLTRAYREYLRNPSIEVTILRRINVSGAVRSPGLYTVDPTMTVTDALALAGGATREGKRREVELVRHGRTEAVTLRDAMRIADLTLWSGDQLIVPERNWIARNPGLIATAVSATVSLVIAFFIR